MMEMIGISDERIAMGVVKRMGDRCEEDFGEEVSDWI